MFITDRLYDRLGGRARARVILVLAFVLGLDGSDKGAVGAMAAQLQQAFNVGTTEIGLLFAVTSFLGAMGTLPYGRAVDRFSRTRLLSIVVLVWGVVMAISASSTSYVYLVASRAALGAVVAAAVPAVASLVGDYFPPRERAGIYGTILAGEFVGTGFGFLIAGELASISWRWGFLALAVPVLPLAWLLKRLPEPSRGGASRIERGQTEIGELHEEEREERQGPRLSQIVAREAGIEPRRELIPDEDPARQSLWWAVHYVLSIPTNVVLIVASALGYFFYAGVRAFGVEYLRGRFDISHPEATVFLVLIGTGALAGVLVGGHFADWLLRQGHIVARVLVAAVSYLVAATLLVPGLLWPNILAAGAFLFAAAIAFGAVNPPLDAGRLDIMHPRLWGRAESTRMMLRLFAEGIAPLLFGFLAGQVFGGGTAGLEHTFLLMLIPLFASGFIGLIALRTYPRDVATADAYTERTMRQ